MIHRFPIGFGEYKDMHNGESCIVAGLGPSVQLMNPSEMYHKIIAVNDFERFGIVPDYLVCIDRLARFPQDRAYHIKNTHAKCAFTQLDAGSLNFTSAQRVQIVLSRYRSQCRLEQIGAVDYGYTSPFVAAVIAYWLGFKRIGVVGVDDLKGHRIEQMFKKVNAEWRLLSEAFWSRGVRIYNLSHTGERSVLGWTMPSADYLDFNQNNI